MALHTNIGDEFFPVDMADPNQLTSYYESYVLIPNLGPLLYSKLYGKLKQMVADFSNIKVLLADIGKYKKQYGELPSTPYIPEVMSITGTPIYESVDKIELNIEEAYTRPANRKPGAVLHSLNTIGYEMVEAAPIANTGKVNSERLKDYKNILAGISKNNGVLEGMVNASMMLSEEGIVSEKLLSLSAEKQFDEVINSLTGNKRSGGISHDVTPVGAKMAKMLLADTPVLKAHEAQLTLVISSYVKRFFDKYKIESPENHIKVFESCEWAFVRKERITIDLMKPRFRGPLKLESVAPESELTLIDSESRMTTSGASTLQATSDDLKQYNSISSEVKNKLGTLFDYGSNLGHTMSEQGFSTDSMQSEKRNRVESALREISQQNSSLTYSSETISSSRIREYSTKGKDPLFATSELSFEAFSPVEVNHYLEDIGAVWCPRITNPFRGLRTNLDLYYLRTYYDYIRENYVIDPMQPVPSFVSIGRVTQDTSKNTSSGSYTEKVTFKLTSNEIASGYFYGDDIQLEFKQHCDWYENCYDEDDHSESFTQNRHGGDSLIDVTVMYTVDNVIGNDPDENYYSVSIDKYKATDAYRQQLQQYTQTIEKTNPARRNAIKVQARKYASLKRDELIRKYDSNIKQLEDYSFTALMKKMFDNNMVSGNWSYYQGIIRSCIDWEKSRMDPEPCDVQALYANELSPYHFLNVRAVRFFLALKPDAEAIFFDTMRKVVDPNWKALFDKVEKYINDQRDKFKALPEDKKRLDTYNAELILGRHLEAVLSNKTFSEE
ncbi:MAG: hypothetical protein R6W31_00895 [Bacteroidales bacterium]